MNQLIVFIGTSLLLISCGEHPESSTAVASEEENSTETVTQPEDSTYVYEEFLGEKLNPIRNYVKKVDSIRYTSDWSLVMDKSFKLNDEEVTATYYVWNDAMKKISVKFLDSSKKAESTYYFKSGELVYADETSMEEMGLDGLVLLENHSFFENGTLIRSINNQDCGAPFNDEYRKAEQKRIMSDLEVIQRELKD